MARNTFSYVALLKEFGQNEPKDFKLYPNRKGVSAEERLIITLGYLVTRQNYED